MYLIINFRAEDDVLCAAVLPVMAVDVTEVVVMVDPVAQTGVVVTVVAAMEAVVTVADVTTEATVTVVAR